MTWDRWLKVGNAWCANAIGKDIYARIKWKDVSFMNSGVYANP
jgi:hypothetical protein